MNYLNAAGDGPANEAILPATDSEAELRKIIGDDATATFEDDPKFDEPNVGGDASSENSLKSRAADDEEDNVDESDEVDDMAEEDEEADDEDEGDEAEYEEEEDEDDDDGDVLDDEDEDEDEEEEDDGLKRGPALKVDGLLGQEDEIENVNKEEKGDAMRDRIASDGDDEEVIAPRHEEPNAEDANGVDDLDDQPAAGKAAGLPTHLIRPMGSDGAAARM